jgi:hypothetical protein
MELTPADIDKLSNKQARGLAKIEREMWGCENCHLASITTKNSRDFLKQASVIFARMLAGDGDIQPPDFNNWTTESLKQIFIPPTRITRVHDNIKTVTFLFPPEARGSDVNAYQCFNLLFLFLFGPNNINRDHTLEDATNDKKQVTEKDRETGYLVTRDDRELPGEWRYHFTVTQNDTTILTAELFESEDPGTRFILHITRTSY